MSLIYHLAPATRWYSWPENKPYLPAEYDKDGFIHCTSGDELMIKVANRFYQKVSGDYVLLVIDALKLNDPPSPVKWEAASEFDALFHISMVQSIEMLLLKCELYDEMMMEHLLDDPGVDNIDCMAEQPQESSDKNVEIWKIKKLIKSLEAARGNGTSMISLIIPPRDQIPRIAKMLADEYGTASNIKSRVNRLSVLSAITSVQARLKLYNKVPNNGLVIYCGTIVTDDGKEKKVNIDFEPFKAINTSLYLCDNKFHTEALQALLADDSRFGFIVMDGNGALFGTLQGNSREVITKFSVDLPKKHGRGGQSALRFARLRMEKRHNYVRKVAETAVQCFITDDKVNVSGLILAGLADFKTELHQSDMFDQRLQVKVLKRVDISYGGENGFNQAIELAAETLGDVKFIQEKKLISRYFDEVSRDSGQYCFGIDETLKALEMGAVETLIVWENFDVTRYVLRNPQSQETKVLHLRSDQEKEKSHFQDKDTGVELEHVEEMPLLEWFANNYKNFGATLEIVTDKSQEGSQFVRGFGGVGGILRYKVDLQNLNIDEDAEPIDYSDYD